MDSASDPVDSENIFLSRPGHASNRLSPEKQFWVCGGRTGWSPALPLFPEPAIALPTGCPWEGLARRTPSRIARSASPVERPIRGARVQRIPSDSRLANPVPPPAQPLLGGHAGPDRRGVLHPGQCLAMPPRLLAKAPWPPQEACSPDARSRTTPPARWCATLHSLPGRWCRRPPVGKHGAPGFEPAG